MQQYIYAFICGITLLLVIYLLFRAVEAILFVVLYIVFILIAAGPFLTLVAIVFIAVKSPQTNGTIEIGGYIYNITTACAGAAVAFIISGLFLRGCLKSKLFRKIYTKINPPPESNETIKVDLTTLKSKSK
jgi:hypothetical protein